MKRQIFNPIFPLDTYIPDGEPHVFGDRVYLYGSHDAEGGERFCMLDYECWSAPVDDLTDWRNEGTIYKAEQCPHRTDERQDMYAPDCVQGNDGRYYLYYCLGGFEGPISVAVCDTPAGKFEYYGDVKHPNGQPLKKYIPFDPGLLNDNGRIYLAYGWGLGHDISQLPEEHRKGLYMQLFGKTPEAVEADGPLPILGAQVVELKDDMLTVKGEPNRVLDARISAPAGSELSKHTFFEAASLRKFGDFYYLIYSSHETHELCYATSKYPDREYQFRGVIISNGDIGYNGRKAEDRLAATGTNHGSLECINGEYYIFYHRNTHLSLYSRQACAEKVTMLPDGTIQQVEVTSCGLNGGALIPKGTYPAPICCNLTNLRLQHPTGMPGEVINPAPNINHEGNTRFVKDIEDNTLIGYKYFGFAGDTEISVVTRGKGQGELAVMTELGKPLVEINIKPSAEWTPSQTVCFTANGDLPLYFVYSGTDKIDLLQITFEER